MALNMKPPILREWQKDALKAWFENRQRGIVSAVTGGGKTILALSAIAQSTNIETVLIAVPTLALLEQWWEEAAAFFETSLDNINVVKRDSPFQKGVINIAVMNTAAKIVPPNFPFMLIVDECHKAASPKLRTLLDIETVASLGLSATPERPYDEGLDEILVPALGPVICRYTYKEARRDGVIVPFDLKNIVFDLEPENQAEYDKLTRSIARSIGKLGMEAPETVALLLKRTRVLNMSLMRVRVALRLVSKHKGQRILVFHESIEACEVIHGVLREHSINVGIYHSRLSLRERADMIRKYRSGGIDVLVTCRALDEGFNVPETQVGIIAASTATRRQRIQRLGRVLRPASGKQGATIYTLVATKPEIQRLRAEEQELEDVANTSWGHA